MTGDYRFLLLDAEMAAVHDMTLVCLNDSDAMLIARRIGGVSNVQVWDDRRLVGFVHARPERDPGRDAEIAA
jgi:hypothetical protein